MLWPLTCLWTSIKFYFFHPWYTVLLKNIGQLPWWSGKLQPLDRIGKDNGKSILLFMCNELPVSQKLQCYILQLLAMVHDFQAPVDNHDTVSKILPHAWHHLANIGISQSLKVSCLHIFTRPHDAVGNVSDYRCACLTADSRVLSSVPA